MLKPQIMLLISQQTPKSAWGDTVWAQVRAYADAWNARTAELTEQVRLGVRTTLNKLATYFASMWREGHTTGFSFYITNSYLTGAKHPLTVAGEQARFRCPKSIYNHIQRLEKVGLLTKESMKKDTTYCFRGGYKHVPCLRLTWSKYAIAILEDVGVKFEEGEPKTHAELVETAQTRLRELLVRRV